jgi:hypothetical protein
MNYEALYIAKLVNTKYIYDVSPCQKHDITNIFVE